MLKSIDIVLTNYIGTNMKLSIFLLSILLSITLSGCETDAKVASRNLAKSAEQFEIYRRVVFFNGITDKYILQIEGLCSIDDKGKHLEVICKRHDGKFVRHHLGLSDNVSYFSEQMTYIGASTLRHRIIFKPATIIPAIDLVLE